MNPESNSKVYLMEKIKNNKLFKDKNFWVKFIECAIDESLEEKYNKDIINSDNNKNEQIYNNLNYIDIASLSNVVFGQIVVITNNIKLFGFNVDEIKEILSPFFSKYKISKEKEDIIYATLSAV